MFEFDLINTLYGTALSNNHLLSRSVSNPFTTKQMIKVAYQSKWDLIKGIHGILCGFAVLIFAISGFLLRVVKWQHVVRLHYWLQLSSLSLLIAGFGTGIWLADDNDKVGNLLSPQLRQGAVSRFTITLRNACTYLSTVLVARAIRP